MLRDADRATDAVQNALVRAWRDLPTLRDPDRFDAWLHRLLVNACIDEMRRVRRRQLDVDITDVSNPPAVADAASAIADRDQLERGFSRLEPEERAVIVLHHYLDLPLPEVAATLGSRWAPPSRASTAGSTRCGRRLTPTLARRPISVKDVRHEPH